MSFFQLSLIAAVALLGPLLALPRKWHLPVVLGQLLAGIAIGRTGLGLVDSADSTFTFVADVGFALVMFVAGTHVPVRDEAIRPALGSWRPACRHRRSARGRRRNRHCLCLWHRTCSPLHRSARFLFSSLVLPIVDSLRLTGPKGPDDDGASGGSGHRLHCGASACCGPTQCGRGQPSGQPSSRCAPRFCSLCFAGWSAAATRGRVHDMSEDRKFALELRIQLALLFALSGLAVARPRVHHAGRVLLRPGGLRGGRTPATGASTLRRQRWLS